MTTDNRTDYFNRLRGSNTYVLSDSVGDRKRLVIQTRLYAPAVKREVARAIEKYGLRSVLEDPNATFTLLDLGCGEGLFFPILNDFFVELGAKAKIVMVGVDRDVTALATAQDYMEALGMSRQVWLYNHDLNVPLTQLEGINLPKVEKHFDLVIATAVFMHLTGARQILNSVYEVIKPGGVFYTRDMRWIDGYEYPSPAFTTLNNLTLPLLMKWIGDDFAQHHTEYLEEAGFENIESFEDTYPVGGKSDTGKRVLENFLLGMHASRPNLTKLGLVSEAEFDRYVSEMFREMQPNLEGHISWLNTIASRPRE